MFVKTYQDTDAQSVDSFRSAMNTLNQMSNRKQSVTVYTRSAVRSGEKNPHMQRTLNLRRKVFASIMLVFLFVCVGVVTSTFDVSAMLLPLFSLATYIFWVRSQLREQSTSSTSTNVKPQSTRTHSLALLARLRRQAGELLTKTEPELKTEDTPAWQPLGTFQQPEIVMPSYIEYKKEVSLGEPVEAWDGAAMIEEAERQKRARALADLVADTPAESVDHANDDTQDIPRVMGA